MVCLPRSAIELTEEQERCNVVCLPLSTIETLKNKNVVPWCVNRDPWSKHTEEQERCTVTCLPQSVIETRWRTRTLYRDVFTAIRDRNTLKNKNVVMWCVYRNPWSKHTGEQERCTVVRVPRSVIETHWRTRTLYRGAFTTIRNRTHWRTRTL